MGAIAALLQPGIFRVRPAELRVRELRTLAVCVSEERSMRIACVDKSAADRLALLEILDDCFALCRSAIGHVTIFQPFPVSKEELLVSTQPDAVMVGPKFAADEAFLLCRDLRRANPVLPILVLVEPSIQSFSTMQRFEGVSSGVFAAEQEAARIVHCLCAIAGRRKQVSRSGKLITLRGVKGGVGTTSLAGGFAHAAQAQGLSAIVVDLSATGAFLLYMLTTKRQSSEYASLLLDSVVPDATAAQRCVTQVPNGISVVLPPSGGTEVRERWLRDANRFEITLTMLEFLAERFDLVIVDLAGTEGVLPYALSCRAAINVLVSSHDPASVHLLGEQRNALLQLPGTAALEVIINEVNPNGLPDEDIVDFLCVHCNLTPAEVRLTRIPHDMHGRAWIGTGNSFYTEATRFTQRRLEAVVGAIAGVRSAESPFTSEAGFMAALKRIAAAGKSKRLRPGKDKSIPLLMPPELAQVPVQIAGENRVSIESRDSPDGIEHSISVESLYQPPTLLTERQ